ncbi:MAG: NAD-dependent epimerase/dehydratase family protein [Parvularculaceae bacterium]|nr:NAD-dependent epimerase/dehydratase family protein [Parvularculaceae bacterium]
MTRIAVTGGTGFVGAALIDLLVSQHHDVVALVRDRRRLTARAGVDVIEGDLDNEQALDALAAGAGAVIHLAGVTHARNDADYDRVNVEGARRTARAARAAGARFVHASSMSARAPSVSAYARSKFDSEGAIRDSLASGNWIALRLPAIYGPGDRATLPYFKLVKSGLALEPATATPARASILFVEDAAAALVRAAQADLPAGVYEVGDDRSDGHAWSEIGAVLGACLGRRPRAIRVPRPLVALTHNGTRLVEGVLGRPPSVRSGQIDEFFHPDWVARENLFSAASGWRPHTPLEEGFAKSVRWYQEKGLL